MQTITTIGFDIAKSVFQVHGVDAAGEVVIRRPQDAPPTPSKFDLKTHGNARDADALQNGA